MAITNGYCTLAELKAHIGKPSSITTNDTLFETAIESASREIDMAITGRRDYVVFEAKTLTASKVMHGFGLNADCLIMNDSRTRIYAPNKINAVTVVNDDGVTLTVGTDYNLGYDFIQSNGFFTGDAENGVKITGTISSDTVPDEIRLLCITMAGIYTGMDTRTMTDADGNSIEVSTRTMPAWVGKKLRSLRMSIY